MPKLNSNSKVAAILYLMLAVFSIGVAPSIQIWTISVDALVELPWHREGELLHGTNGLLFIYSIVMAVSVRSRLPVEKTRFVFALVLAFIAFTWNVVLGLLWLLPAIFCWLATREVMAPDPS